MKRVVVLLALVVACKGKAKEQPASGSASAVAVAPPAIDAAPAVDAAAALPTSSTRNGPWGLDAKAKQTLAQIKAAGYTVDPDAQTDRASMKAGFLTTKPDMLVGVLASYASEGGDGSIAFYETVTSTDKLSPAELEKVGLCVEGVCPGAPLATAEKLKLDKCVAYTIEMMWWFACAVPDSSMTVVVLHPTHAFKGAKHEAPIAFSKLVAAKLTIEALAWGAWEPVTGCTTDCD